MPTLIDLVFSRFRSDDQEKSETVCAYCGSEVEAAFEKDLCASCTSLFDVCPVGPDVWEVWEHIAPEDSGRPRAFTLVSPSRDEQWRRRELRVMLKCGYYTYKVVQRFKAQTPEEAREKYNALLGH